VIPLDEETFMIWPHGAENLKDFLSHLTDIHQNIQFTTETGSGVHPTSYTMGTGSFFPGVKRPGREGYHSPPTSAEVKKIWILTSTPPYAFMA
jgi:hypothetical protein